MDVLKALISNNLDGEHVLLKSIVLSPALRDILLWVKRIEAGDVDFILAKPKSQFSFDQYLLLHKKLKTHFGGIVILDGSEINPKYRSLFSRHGVEYLIPQKTLFAPSLGVLNLKVSRAQNNSIHRKRNNLNPFELKLIGGSLTHQIPFKSFNGTELKNFFLSQGFDISLAKVTSAINQLVDLELITVVGKGPKRQNKFVEKQDLWARLCELEVLTFFDLFEFEDVNLESPLIYSHETVLSILGNLNEERVKFYAIYSKEFSELKKSKNFNIDYSDPKVKLTVMKEPPMLFSFKKCLNPVELYFMLRGNRDPRIEETLYEFLMETCGLKMGKSHYERI